jgi:surface protein
MNFSNKKPKIDSMSEPNSTVKYSDVSFNDSNFITDENFYILHWLYRIRNKNCSKGIRIGFLQPDFLWCIIRPMMRNKKLWRTDDDIYEAVALWCIERAEAEKKYGHISDWDVSSVTNMSHLFHSQKLFNDDISRWDVSNVSDMGGMFSMAHSFNQHIGRWNVSKVTNMCLMFGCAYLFDHPIGGWNVSNVLDMERMFQGAREFNQHVGAWNVSNVYDMEFMFAYTRKFNQSIDSWNMSNVINIRGIFFEAIQMELLINKL